MVEGCEDCALEVLHEHNDHFIAECAACWHQADHFHLPPPDFVRQSVMRVARQAMDAHDADLRRLADS